MTASPAIFNIAFACDRLAVIGPWCVYGFGLSVLAVRIRPVQPFAPQSLAAIWLIIFLIAFLFDWFRRRRYSADFARAWLDLHNRAGGRIIAGAAAGPVPVKPVLSLRHVAAKLALPLLFSLVACLVPAREPSIALSGAGLRQPLAALERRLDAAEREGVLTQPEVTALRQQLEQLSALIENRPEAGAEALSALNRAVEASVSDRLERSAQALEKTMVAARGGEAVAQAGEAMIKAWNEFARGEGGMENLPGEMRAALSEAVRESGAASLEHMAGNPAEAAGKLSAATTERVLRALAENAERSAQSATGLSGAPAGDRIGTLGKALGDLAEKAESGSGGIGKGGGPTPMTFSGETEEAGARFRYEALPRAEGVTSGMKLADERVVPPDDMPLEFRPVWRSGATVDGPLSAGDSAVGLGPSRARAARRYFERLNEGNAHE